MALNIISRNITCNPLFMTLDLIKSILLIYKIIILVLSGKKYVYRINACVLTVWCFLMLSTFPYCMHFYLFFLHTKCLLEINSFFISGEKTDSGSVRGPSRWTQSNLSLGSSNWRTTCKYIYFWNIFGSININPHHFRKKTFLNFFFIITNKV